MSKMVHTLIEFSFAQVYFREFSNVDTHELEEMLQANKQPFETSQLYAADTKIKFVDEALRRSSFRAIKDTRLLDVAEKIVQFVNQHDALYRYQLVRNNVTEIVYLPGGFFDTHRDFISLTSNVVEEFTMIICITPADVVAVGGETVIYLAPNNAQVLTSTTTRGQALVFRKDLLHKSLPLESGEKRIVTLNLWGTRKQHDDRIMVINFPCAPSLIKNGSPGATESPDTGSASDVANRDEDQAGHGDEIKDATNSLRDLALNSKSYALSVSAILAFPQSLLARKIAFEDAANPSQATRSPILSFVCENASFDEFDVVYNIYQRCRVRPSEVAQNLDLLRFHGFVEDDLLMDLVEDLANQAPQRKPKKEIASDDSPKHTSSSLDESLSDDERKVPAPVSDNSGVDGLSAGAIGSILLCPTQDAARVVAAMARSLQLPYVPFQIWFASGSSGSGHLSDREVSDGDEAYDDASSNPDRATHFKQLPVWFSVGDYNNIVGFRRLLAAGDRWARAPLAQGPFPDCTCLGEGHVAQLQEPDTVLQVHRQGKYDDRYRAGKEPVFLHDYESLMARDGCHTFSMGLQIAYAAQASHCDHASFVFDSILLGSDSNDEHTARGLIDNIVVLPGGNDLQQPGPREAPFHYDSSGKSCFSAVEAAAVATLLTTVDVVGLARAALESTSFVLPQDFLSSDVHMCNEDVYAEASVLCVSGVLRLAE